MGKPFIIYGDDHKCTLCKVLYKCRNLKKKFCDEGYHSICKVFICKNCPDKLDLNYYY